MNEVERKQFLFRTDSEKFKVPLIYENGHLDNVRCKNIYVFTKEDNEKIIIKELNTNCYECYSSNDNEVKFELFIQPYQSRWFETDVISFEPDKNYDIIIIDPPWKFNGSNPVRRVAIDYQCLSLKQIKTIDLEKYQDDFGLVAFWVVNKSYLPIIKWMNSLNYNLLHELQWIKVTKKGKLHKSVGHYMQHAKETCLIFGKGKFKLKGTKGINDHIIWSERRIQSQKPNILYTFLELQFNEENINKIELFGRFLNLRSGWHTIGYQVLPSEQDCWIFLNRSEKSVNESLGSIAI